MNAIQTYLSWRPVMTADQFWVALLKSVPYEVTSAYTIIRLLYPGSADVAATSFLLFLLFFLSGCTFFLYRSSAGASRGSAASLAICFLLFGLTVDANNFGIWIEGLACVPVGIASVLIAILQPYYLVAAAVIIILCTSALRSTLGKRP